MKSCFCFFLFFVFLERERERERERTSLLSSGLFQLTHVSVEELLNGIKKEKMKKCCGGK